MRTSVDALYGRQTPNGKLGSRNLAPAATSNRSRCNDCSPQRGQRNLVCVVRPLASGDRRVTCPAAFDDASRRDGVALDIIKRRGLARDSRTTSSSAHLLWYLGPHGQRQQARVREADFEATSMRQEFQK